MQQDGYFVCTSCCPQPLTPPLILCPFDQTSRRFCFLTHLLSLATSPCIPPGPSSGSAAGTGLAGSADCPCPTSGHCGNTWWPHHTFYPSAAAGRTRANLVDWVSSGGKHSKRALSWCLYVLINVKITQSLDGFKDRFVLNKEQSGRNCLSMKSKSEFTNVLERIQDWSVKEHLNVKRLCADEMWVPWGSDGRIQTWLLRSLRRPRLTRS